MRVPPTMPPLPPPPPARIRLHVAAALAAGAEVALSADQAHYLASVMRLRPGAAVRLFNGDGGEWRATVVVLDRKAAIARLAVRTRPPAPEPGPVLVFALIKRDRLDLVVEKATELGVERLVPVTTRRTVTQPPNPARLAAIAREAAEQSGRLTLPAIEPPRPLDRVLADWPAARPLLLADPAAARPVGDALAAAVGPPGVLIGPEGGFVPSELDELHALPFVVPVSLGPLVLRAETAAVALLACCRALQPIAGAAGPAGAAPEEG
jgi:16S rRNA (uracil1498-N3)-methyltransferase